MVELITVIVIVGIIGAIAAPRFFERSVFDSRGYYDQLISSIRYAQKVAIAERRYVCVAVASNGIVLTQGTTTACGGNVANPAGGTSYSVNAPGGVTSGTAGFYFDAIGRPSAAQSIAVSGYATPIVVEQETGYVH